MKKNRDGSFTGKSEVAVEDWMNIPWLLDRRTQKYPHQVCIERQMSIGTWSPVTTTEFSADILAVARGLVAEGLEEGDALAIFASTSYEWNLIDMAALSAGLITVPIYESDLADQVKWILENSNIKFVITETEAQRFIVESVRTPALGRVISLADDGLRTLYSNGAAVDPEVIDKRKANLNMDTVATVIYTSGTTGNPKGVMLTHGNFVNSALNVQKNPMGIIVNGKDTRILLFLPMAHVMARSVFFYLIAGRGVIGHTPNLKNLVADIGSFKPTGLLVVPRVLEKIYNAAAASAGGGVKKRIFRWASEVAVDYSAKRHTPGLKLKAGIANKLVWSKIRDVIGEQCVYAVSAGAPLGSWMGHFFRGIGLTVVEAYGLTETTGASTVNYLGAIKMGTVGQPMANADIKVADDSEVLVRGPHVFKGYQNNPEETALAKDSEGWFYTGDLGTLDKDGYLTITGRKKEIIVTAGGKNVSPAALEDPLRSHPLISQIVVIGDQKPFVAALITLDQDMLPSWLSSHGLPPMDVQAAAQDEHVLASLEKAIERTNKKVSRAESIRKFTVLPVDFTVENGLLTPSLKVKRARVTERFSDAIDQLYTDTRSEGEK